MLCFGRTNLWAFKRVGDKNWNWCMVFGREYRERFEKGNRVGFAFSGYWISPEQWHCGWKFYSQWIGGYADSHCIYFFQRKLCHAVI